MSERTLSTISHNLTYLKDFQLFRGVHCMDFVRGSTSLSLAPCYFGGKSFFRIYTPYTHLGDWLPSSTSYTGSLGEGSNLQLCMENEVNLKIQRFQLLVYRYPHSWAKTERKRVKIAINAHSILQNTWILKLCFHWIILSMWRKA